MNVHVQQLLDVNDEIDPLENVVFFFQLHISIKTIKQKHFKEVFDFTLLKTEEVLTEISKLNYTKSTTGISISLFKDNSEICTPIKTSIFNSCIKNGIFPE